MYCRHQTGFQLAELIRGCLGEMPREHDARSKQATKALQLGTAFVFYHAEVDSPSLVAIRRLMCHFRSIFEGPLLMAQEVAAAEIDIRLGPPMPSSYV